MTKQKRWLVAVALGNTREGTMRRLFALLAPLSAASISVAVGETQKTENLPAVVRKPVADEDVAVEKARKHLQAEEGDAGEADRRLTGPSGRRDQERQ